MATSGYSEDLQSQQTNTVAIATPTAAAPSSAKAAHFLSKIPPASTSITASNPSAVSKAGQDALCSQAAANQNQNQKAVCLASATQHYVTSDIQQSAAQKTNGQSSSPQYIIVTVTGERSANEPRLYTHSHSSVCVCVYGAFGLFSVLLSIILGSALSGWVLHILNVLLLRTGTRLASLFIFGLSICRSFCPLVSSHTVHSHPESLTILWKLDGYYRFIDWMMIWLFRANFYTLKQVTFTIFPHCCLKTTV